MKRDQKIPFNSLDDNLVFQITSWHTCDYEYDEVEDPREDATKYLVKVFGVREDGTSVALNILNFTPFFFLRIDHKTDRHTATRLKDFLVTKLPTSLKTSILDVTILKKKDFWGFTNNTKKSFARLKFKNLKAMKSAIRIFSKKVDLPEISRYPIKYKLYESNIDPFLRMIHIRDIDPCGWVMVPKGRFVENTGILPSHCQIDVECHWNTLVRHDAEKIAPLSVASFDIECTSSHGDFPVARKNYKKLAYEVMQYYNNHKYDDNIKDTIYTEILKTFDHNIKEGCIFSKVYPKNPQRVDLQDIEKKLKRAMDDIFSLLGGRLAYKSHDSNKSQSHDSSKESKQTASQRDAALQAITKKMGDFEVVEGDFGGVNSEKWVGMFPPLEGDPIIQIGTTVHTYGAKDCAYKSILTVGSCALIEGTEVIECKNEKELILKWRDLVIALDPDVMTGYNIFGFDMNYLVDRAKELGIFYEFCKIGRLLDHASTYVEKTLSSSALGDNLLKYVDMEGRVLIDVMKVVQRDHKLDSYKLDAVANHFMKMNKHDVHPSDIVRLFNGDAEDRKRIAAYCVQDCALCNHLIIKLEILANNIGMANVCSVPLSFIFMRGQGIKIFSLVAKECRVEDYVIPTLVKVFKDDDGEEIAEDEDGYEGAIVLEPKCGIYIDDPVNVLDYASLYPSSMISENLSHDSIVLDPAYDNLPGYEYLDIIYDIYEKIDEKKVKTGEKKVRFVQLPNNEKSTIPKILMKLLRQRKETRKKVEFQTVTLNTGEVLKGLVKESHASITISQLDGSKMEYPRDQVATIEDTYDDFQKAVLDGLQLAYKVTANSLYGQCGAKTSPIYMKEIAACTTATGRKMILMAKEFLETHYMAEIVYGDSVTGDTPMLIKFPNGSIDIRSIDSLVAEDEWTGYDAFKPDNTSLKNKQQGQINAQVWTNGEWADIRRVIRHKTQKRIFRVNTLQGCVDVTEDHSLIDICGQEIKPKDCLIDETEIMHSFPNVFCSGPYNIIKEHEAWIMGLCMALGVRGEDGTWMLSSTDYVLLKKAKRLWRGSRVVESVEKPGEYVLYGTWHVDVLLVAFNDIADKKVPPSILNAPQHIRVWFLEGYCNAFNVNHIDTDMDAKWVIPCHGKVGSQGIFYLLKSIGYTFPICVMMLDYESEIYWISNCFNKDFLQVNANRVMENVDLGYISEDAYVYDIETSAGVFQGGVGSIVCKNTDSIFAIFPNKDENGNTIRGKDAIKLSIQTAMKASKEFRVLLKAPHDLEYEKTFWPFILFSKKRYCANKYEFDDQHYKMNSMGIALKRRDNAHIVKKVYGGILDIILNEQDINKSVKFLRESLNNLVDGVFPLEDLIITKSLRADYKDPDRIAHKVLAERMGERDPGTKPQVNDRIPFVYVQVDEKKGQKVLQGERIEHPDYIVKKKLKPDYEFYITNQIMKPVLQLYALALKDLEGYRKGESYFTDMIPKLIKDKEGDMKKVTDKINDLKEAEARKLLFDPILIKLQNKKNGNKMITEFFS